MPKQTPFLFDIHSVSELTESIKSVLEEHFLDILVEGEISNVKQSRNGHYYFTLKDSGAQLPCVMWKNTVQRLGVQLKDGQQVVVGGDIQVYAPHGRYQMIVNLVQQAGIGKLQQAFEKLKFKLKEEGLFEDRHKKPLPPFPERIGVITSATGAAFQDIRSTLEKRWPLAELHLCHASVQGVNAAPEIVKGIEFFSNNNEVDLLIIGRGGGSLEDLWAFNEEAVARAVFACKIPVVSAVGHEVDFSISDFVADARAATPTQAAILSTPDINEIRFLVEDLSQKVDRSVSDKLTNYKETVEYLAKSHALLTVRQKIDQARSQVAHLADHARHRTQAFLSEQKSRSVQLGHRLEKLNPNEPLERGFVRVHQNESWIRQAGKFRKKEPFSLEWKDDKVEIG